MASTEETVKGESQVIASLYFLARDPKYKLIKPYTVRYDPEGKFPYTNIDNVKHDVKLCDLRPILDEAPGDITWKKHGFQIVTIPEQMTYEDLNNDETLRGSHIPHILTVIQSRFQAKKIHVLDYRIRKRDGEFPVRSAREYRYLQPSSRVHIDYTKSAVCKTVQGCYGEEARTILGRPWQVINVWHPLRGPCVDWPLAVCDASSVNFLEDTMDSDFVDTWGYLENTQVHFNESQKWYHLKNQMPNELLVFRSADSNEGEDGIFPGAPHAAFDNPLATPADPPRESLEIRLLAVF